MAVYEGGLGRREAPDDKHLRLYSLTPQTLPTQPESLVVGFSWTSVFDRPVEKTGPDGKPEYWAGLDKNNLGTFRGGHCVCLPYDPAADPNWAYPFFNQGQTGCCVGFGWSRRQAIANRRKYDAFAFYDYTVAHDEFPDTNDRNSGTSVRAGGETMLHVGEWEIDDAGKTTGPILDDGIQEYVWARSVDDMLAVLRNPVYQQRGAVPLLNSWGENYPHLVWVPLDTWNEVLFVQNTGDCALATDRPGGAQPTPTPTPTPNPDPQPCPKPHPKPKPKPHRRRLDEIIDELREIFGGNG